MNVLACDETVYMIRLSAMIPYFVPVDFISKEDVEFLENLVQSADEADSKAYDTISGKKDGNSYVDINLDYFNRSHPNSYTFFVPSTFFFFSKAGS